MSGRTVEVVRRRLPGYRGDELLLLLMRDGNSAEKLEKKLHDRRTNIGTIVKNRIEVLTAEEEVRSRLTAECDLICAEIADQYRCAELIGESQALRLIRESLPKIGRSGAPILITGEPGTGKSLVANLLHQYSSRKEKRMVTVACAAGNEELLGREIFGRQEGIAAEAGTSRLGKLKIADGSTFYLEDIGGLSPRLQLALLRVMETGKMPRTGSSMDSPVDVRLIASTRADLPDKIAQGLFRRDFYYRLGAITLHLPPLRERRDDILPLASHFLHKYRPGTGTDLLPAKTIELLLGHDWPGNVEELENTIERANSLAFGRCFRPEDFTFLTPPPSGATGDDDELCRKPLKKAVAELEKKVIAAALQHCQGQAPTAAAMIGMSKTVLYERLKRYGLK